ncbi:MAG: SAM-dependent methyltransferase [Myxococcota bacterium]|jgi:SAM-dependent methyltransferase
MRREHLEAFAPVCPRCRADFHRDNPVRLARVGLEANGHIVDGALHCTDSGCLMEYPIIDGIPLLVNNLRRFISDNFAHLMWRDDLSDIMESMVGDAVGPNAVYNSTRQYLSSYTWDHYADLDPNEPARPGDTGSTDRGSRGRSSGVVDCLEAGLSLHGVAPEGPSLDCGCSVGRTTFELAARSGGLALGIDLNLAMLRLATRVLRDGVVSYPRRRVGLVYDRHRFAVDFDSADRVDFWCCDATALPLAAGSVKTLVGLNVLDCVTSPLELLQCVSRTLAPGGRAVLATPYDWSPGATAVESWIGGHSQRGTHHGATEPLLQLLLTPGAHPQSIQGLTIQAENLDVPWSVRLHDRSTMQYTAHVLALVRGTEP